jgi:hypothetical protein
LSSRLLSRNVKVKIYETIIMPVVLYGCETWSLTSREEHRLKFFENRVLRRIFGPKKDELTGDRRKLHSEELHNLYSPQILLDRLSQGELGGQGIWHAWGVRENCTRFRWESQKERDLWEDRRVDGWMDNQNGS